MKALVILAGLILPQADPPPIIDPPTICRKLEAGMGEPEECGENPFIDPEKIDPLIEYPETVFPEAIET